MSRRGLLRSETSARRRGTNLCTAIATERAASEEHGGCRGAPPAANQSAGQLPVGAACRRCSSAPDALPRWQGAPVPSDVRRPCRQPWAGAAAPSSTVLVEDSDASWKSYFRCHSGCRQRRRSHPSAPAGSRTTPSASISRSASTSSRVECSATGGRSVSSLRASSPDSPRIGLNVGVKVVRDGSLEREDRG